MPDPVRPEGPTPVKGQIGTERFNALGNDQQAALTSVAYNYGSLPDRIVEALKTGNAATVSEAIRGLGSDNEGVNAERRSKEADIYAAGGDTAKSAQILAEAESKRAEKAKEYNTELTNRLSLQGKR